MQGNIPPNEDIDDDDDLNINFDSMELTKQLEIMYGKDYISQLMKESKNNNFNINETKVEGENENYRKNANDDVEINLHLPPSN